MHLLLLHPPTINYSHGGGVSPLAKKSGQLCKEKEGIASIRPRSLSSRRLPYPPLRHGKQQQAAGQRREVALKMPLLAPPLARLLPPFRNPPAMYRTTLNFRPSLLLRLFLPSRRIHSTFVRYLRRSGSRALGLGGSRAKRPAGGGGGLWSLAGEGWTFNRRSYNKRSATHCSK